MDNVFEQNWLTLAILLATGLVILIRHFVKSSNGSRPASRYDLATLDERFKEDIRKIEREHQQLHLEHKELHTKVEDLRVALAERGGGYKGG